MGYIIKDFKKSDIIPNGSIYMETISKSIELNSEVKLETFLDSLYPLLIRNQLKRLKNKFGY